MTSNNLSRLASLFLDSKYLTISIIEQKLDVTRRHAYRLIHLLKKRGFTIKEIKKKGLINQYVLLDEQLEVSKLLISKKELIALNSLDAVKDIPYRDTINLLIERINQQVQTGHGMSDLS